MKLVAQVLILIANGYQVHREFFIYHCVIISIAVLKAHIQGWLPLIMIDIMFAQGYKL